VIPMSPHSGWAEDLRAGHPREDVPSATQPSSPELDHLSDFKRRPKGSSGKFQSLVLDIRIKEWRQSNGKPWLYNAFNDAFEMAIPSTAEISVRDPHAV